MCPRNLGWPQTHLTWAVGQPDGRAIWKDSDSRRNRFSASELNWPLGWKEASEFTAEGQVGRPKENWLIKVIEVRTEEEKIGGWEVQLKRCPDEKRRLQNHMYNKIHMHMIETRNRYWRHPHEHVSRNYCLIVRSLVICSSFSLLGCICKTKDCTINVCSFCNKNKRCFWKVVM